MAEKQQTSPYRESHSRSVKFVYPVSFASLLICVTALVGVEIINQRVHTIEDGEGKRRHEFAEWHVAWHNYAKYDTCGMT